MANIAATFTSGLVLGSGAVCAFATFFTEQAHFINYKLKRASTELTNATESTKVPLPTWKESTPEIMSIYEQFSARISGNAIPLAKSRWNDTISSAANKLAQVDIDADKLVTALRRE
ncbi:hypothetical protein IWW36_002251 [Coemansia brasiliensis]|uniref:Uncharacterized protein n=1 Tax=Coemansia brasiliensis TaxID=2650707 RepID=A0A9W8IG98_9FUNG|nr:hypothetical protein IWW36_002251 [Coemansia brasiliensis]